MSIRRLGDDLMCHVIAYLMVPDVSSLVQTSRTFRRLFLSSFEEKCKISCLVEYVRDMMVCYKMHSTVPNTWSKICKVFTKPEPMHWTPCSSSTSSSMKQLKYDHFEYISDPDSQQLVKCGGHYFFCLWKASFDSIVLEERNETSSDVESIKHSTIEIKEWRRIKLNGVGPRPRRSHSAIVLPPAVGSIPNISHKTKWNRFLVFGGQAQEFPFDPFNDMYICLSECNSIENENIAHWVEPDIVSGQAPSPRCGHVMTSITASTILLSGGSHGTRPIQYCDIYLLHIDVEGFCTFRWSTPFTETYGPLGRACHSVMRFNPKTFLIFGGKQVGESNGLLDVHCLDLNILNNTCTWTRTPIQGDIPSPRRGHSIIPIGNNMILFGGENSNGHLLNSLHVFNGKQLIWKEYNIDGPVPSPRRGQCIYYCGMYIVIQSGFQRNNKNEIIKMSENNSIFLNFL